MKPTKLSQMAFVDLTPSATSRDRIWQAVYRLGHPVACVWWRLSRPRHEGALVAIYVGDKLFLVRPSYRSEWTFPGGSVEPGETQAEAARRELVEEIGVEVEALEPVCVVAGSWDGRSDQVHIFRLVIDRPLMVKLDNREIIAARLAAPDELAGLRLTGPVRAYLRETTSPASCGRAG